MTWTLKDLKMPPPKYLAQWLMRHEVIRHLIRSIQRGALCLV